MTRRNILTMELRTNPHSTSGWMGISKDSGYPHSYIREEADRKVKPKDVAFLTLIENGAQVSLKGIIHAEILDYKETFIVAAVPGGTSQGKPVGCRLTLGNVAVPDNMDLSPDGVELNITLKPGDRVIDVVLDHAGVAMVELVEED